MFAVLEFERIPTYLRDFQVFRHISFKRLHTAFDQSETFVFSVFKTLFKQDLHPEADPEQGSSAFRFFAHERVQPSAAEFFRGIGKSPDAGKYQFVRFFDRFRVSADRHAFSDRGKRTLKRKKIADAVINNNGHLQDSFC